MYNYLSTLKRHHTNVSYSRLNQFQQKQIIVRLSEGFTPDSFILRVMLNEGSQNME